MNLRTSKCLIHGELLWTLFYWSHSLVFNHYLGGEGSDLGCWWHLLSPAHSYISILQDVFWSKVIGVFRETFVFFSSDGNQSLGFFPWCWHRKNTEACLHSWLSPSFASETPDTLSLCTFCLLNTGPDSQFVFDFVGLFSSVNKIYV